MDEQGFQLKIQGVYVGSHPSQETSWSNLDTPHPTTPYPPLCAEVKEKPKKEAGHCILVGGSFTKQENLYTGLGLVQHQDKWILHMPAKS